MLTHAFFISYFASKNVTFLTAFICWPTGNILELYNEARGYGVRLIVYRDISNLPELPAYDVYREGVLLDLDFPDADLILQKASDNRAFVSRFSWLLLHNGTYETNITESFFDINILPDSDVKISGPDYLLDIYKIKPNHPLVITSLDLNRNSSLNELSSFWNNFPTPVKRRKDLNNVHLTAATIITQPQHFKGWSDLTNREIDTYPKLTYPLMMLCSEDLNFRYNLRQVDLYGDELNGSFNGLAGLLQRNEIEVGITSMFMRADSHYWDASQKPCNSIVSFCSLPIHLGTSISFIFSISALSRIHLVYISSGMTSSHLRSIDHTLWNNNLSCTTAGANHPSGSKILDISPNKFPACPPATRVRCFSIVYESYPILRNFAMSSESNEPATQRLYRHKLLPLGERAYLSVVDGISRVRSGLFAYQVEQSSGYDVISKTFEEHEKCGLKEIEAFSLPMVAIPIRKHSGYKELFASMTSPNVYRLRWQREVGLVDRASSIWLAAKPRCDSAASGFVSVGLLDILPAVQVLAAGALIALLILLAEITFAKSSRNLLRCCR
ncbi:hypothetical protein K1T71_008539 [Dendrolimus kikuchii]|uniref:Uncharacterized protein n=1 Tax=Dendrolimus kikuchii TaxID=765133 RepID=A0ACC1CUT9_9NEOP|nr:hypothetical protein K1T71_008539 [Dendrolimus kikuchii]